MWRANFRPRERGEGGGLTVKPGVFCLDFHPLSRCRRSIRLDTRLRISTCTALQVDIILLSSTYIGRWTRFEHPPRLNGADTIVGSIIACAALSIFNFVRLPAGAHGGP